MHPTQENSVGHAIFEGKTLDAHVYRAVSSSAFSWV